jgi:hypothetical protein
MGLAAVCLLLFAGGSGVTSAAATAGARTYWGKGIAAVLPANAVQGASNQVVDINSISCASVGDCSAVGEYRNQAGRPEGLLLTETARKWATAIEAVLPANADVAEQLVTLNSVSCASPGNCSVGSYYDGSGAEDGLLLTETAGKWATGVEAVLPADAAVTNQTADLRSVSCTSAGDCTALGSYSGTGGGALLLTETAGKWATGVEAALPANASTTEPVAGLSSVSCASAGNCSAVGLYVDSFGNAQGLLLTETAGTWGTGVEAALPANATTTSTGEQVVDLPSVSCSSAGNCSAVGSYNNDTGSDDAVLLTETAGTWATGVKAALPTNADPTDQVDLNAVSCPSAGSCAAVGDYVDRAGNIRSLLLTRGAGKWSRGIGVALPANATHTAEDQLGGLASVSCASPGNCSAVGKYRSGSDGSGVQGLLVTETDGSWLPGVEAVLPKYGGDLTSVSCSSARDCSAVGGFEDARGVLLSSSATPPCVVPELKGKLLAGARRSIKAHECSVGRIGHAASRTVAEGRVISQKPKPGTQLKRGARVSVVVSRGKTA